MKTERPRGRNWRFSAAIPILIALVSSCATTDPAAPAQIQPSLEEERPRSNAEQNEGGAEQTSPEAVLPEAFPGQSVTAVPLVPAIPPAPEAGLPGRAVRGASHTPSVALVVPPVPEQTGVGEIPERSESTGAEVSEMEPSPGITSDTVSSRETTPTDGVAPDAAIPIEHGSPSVAPPAEAAPPAAATAPPAAATSAAAAPSAVSPVARVPSDGATPAASAPSVDEAPVAAARPIERAPSTAAAPMDDEASAVAAPEPPISTPPPPEERRTALAVEPGSPFEIRLPGTMWVYLGTDGVVDFIRRSTDGDESVFSFRFPGNAPTEIPELRFEMQDLATGAIRRRLVALEPSDSPDMTDEGASPADMAVREGMSERATPGSGDVPAETPPDERTLTERIDDALSADRPVSGSDETLSSDLVAAIEENQNDGVDANRVRLLLDRLIADGDTEGAIALLESLLRNGWRPYDRWLYSLARLYEQNGPFRDLRRSHALYSELVDTYPLSVHWNESRSRIEYLDRHFFLIR